MQMKKPRTKDDGNSNVAWRNFFLAVVLIISLVIGTEQECGAKSYLFHAAKKRVARKIRYKGFSTSKMKSRSRFGKGIYFSRTPRTALREKRGTSTVVRAEPTKRFKRNTLNLTRPSQRKIRSYVKVKDLRGSVKRNVIGPKLGRKIGRYASKKGKVIRYRSAKAPTGMNYFVPKGTYTRNKNIIKNIRVKPNGRYY
jgi:hypothetical protein